MTLLPWGLFRRPDGKLEIAFRAFCDEPTWRFLNGHATRPEAVAARKAQEEADKRPPATQLRLLEGE